MKLKQHPDDFQVEELTDVTPSSEGAFAFYRMEKIGWSTPDALAAIRRRWKIEHHRLGYGGLKDRHARTIQYLTIFHGPRRNLEHHQIRVTYLGQLRSSYSSKAITANRFRVTVRDLARTAIDETSQRLKIVSNYGVPNYFDDQRFGSVQGPQGEWIARLLIRGQFEQALLLALAQPYEFDRAEEKREKELLREHWGDWARLKAELPRGHARSLIDYLRVHPTDFKGAVARLRPDLRSLYLSAYQSHLWNQCLSRWLTRQLTTERLRWVELRTGPVPVPTLWPEAIYSQAWSLMLPLPSSRWRPETHDPRLPVVEEVLAEQGVTLRELQIRGLRELFFSKGERAALAVPTAMHSSWSEDERHPGQAKLELSFELPRGSYATIVVKAIC